MPLFFSKFERGGLLEFSARGYMHSPCSPLLVRTGVRSNREQETRKSVFSKEKERDDDDDDEISPPVSLPKSSPNSGGGSIDHGHVAAAFSCGARPGGRCARGIIHRWAIGRGRAHVVRGTGASFIYVMTGMAVVRPWRPVPSSSGAMQAAHQFVSAIPHPRRTPTPRTPGAACCPTSIQLSAR